MTDKHYLYTLVFDADPEPVVFYVGHTNDPKRRETEHRRAALDPRNTEYKYQWCRNLAAVGVAWQFIVVGEIGTDEDSEHEWVLRFARHNQDLGIEFIDQLPLTNMKAGDFLAEILADRSISTRDEIREYRIQREQARAVDYERVRPTAAAQKIIDGELVAAEASVLASYQEQKRKLEQDLAYEKMLKDPDRQRKIAADTLRLMLLEGIITAREYDLAVQESGGYPDWTTLPSRRIDSKRK